MESFQMLITFNDIPPISSMVYANNRIDPLVAMFTWAAQQRETFHSFTH